MRPHPLRRISLHQSRSTIEPTRPCGRRLAAKLLTKDEARRIACQYRQAAGAFAEGIANRTHIRACESLSGKPVEQQWKTCCSRQNCRDVLFVWSRAEERGACRPVDTALSFKSFRAILGRAFFYFRPFFCQSIAARVSSDNPRLKAFCRVAPSVLFKVRAIVAARVLLFASFFNVRTSFAVQVRLRLFIALVS